MIDLHTHILHGVDDGPATLEGSIALARAFVDAGVHTVVATPHVREDYPTTVETMQSRVTELRAALRAAEIPLEVRPGGELAVERLRDLPPNDRRSFELGGETSYLLLEFPYYGWPLELATRVDELRSLGVRPLLAHPERNPDVQSSPERLLPIVRAGALVQVTAASVDGRLGRRAKRAVSALLELGAVHVMASDTHAPDSRRLSMRPALSALRDDGLARWLSREVPEAILAGEPIPERPASRARRWLRHPGRTRA